VRLEQVKIARGRVGSLTMADQEILILLTFAQGECEACPPYLFSNHQSGVKRGGQDWSKESG
jgi:hypothetical protein